MRALFEVVNIQDPRSKKMYLNRLLNSVEQTIATEGYQVIAGQIRDMLDQVKAQMAACPTDGTVAVALLAKFGILTTLNELPATLEKSCRTALAELEKQVVP